MPDGAVPDVQNRVEDVQMDTEDDKLDDQSLSRLTSDGQITHIPNGVAAGLDGTPRGRKRKITDLSPDKRGRHVSPPWRKVVVEGPTSFIQDGRRKSSRTNAVPLELQAPSKTRQTRAGHLRQAESKLRKVQNSSSRTATKSVASGDKTAKRSSRQDGVAQTSHGHARTSQREADAQHTVPNASARSSSRRGQLKRAAVTAKTTELQDVKPEHRKWRRRRSSTMPDVNHAAESSINTSPSLLASSPPAILKPIKSLRLNYRPPPLPVLHPGNALRSRKFSSLRTFLTYDNDLDGDEEHPINDKQAKDEALVLVRLENAAKPGGLLSEERWTGDAADVQDEPSNGFAHMDYLLKHVVDFQPRLQREKLQHLVQAKRLAHLAYAEWKRRQPQTEEEKWAEKRTLVQSMYTKLMKELQSKWMTVRSFVVNQRIARETAQMEAKTKEELKRMLDASTHNLKMRLAQGVADDSSHNSDASQSDLEDDRSCSDADSSDDSEATSTESAKSDAESEGNDDALTQEALRQKYRNLYESEQPANEAQSVIEKHQETDTKDMLYSRSPSDSAYGGFEERLCDMLREPAQPNQNSTRKLMQGDFPTMKNLDLGKDSDGSLDTSMPSLEEVDDILLDGTDDEDGDEDEDNSDEQDDNSDDDQEAQGSEQADASASEDSDEDFGLLGFYNQRQQQTLVKTAPKLSTQHLEMSDQHSPSEARQDTAYINGLPSIGQSEIPSNPAFPADAHGATEHLTPGFNSSDEASRQMSPSTTNTAKPSEADSMTSIEAFEETDALSVKEVVEPESFKTEVSPLLRGQLRNYQHAGLDWLASMYASQANGILADEMGLGKTIQTIALLAHLATEHHIWGPHLIVVPTSVMLNWEMEFKKWCPGFKILTYYGTSDERKEKRRGWSKDATRWNVCITSYQLAVVDATALKKRHWHYMVLDEAHNIKNFQSQRWQTLLTFKTQARLLLTGTPLQNNLTELWSLLFFLEPDQDEQGGFKFSDLATFSRTFHKPVEMILEHGRNDLDDEARELVVKLHKVLRPHLLRRLKADVEKQMPKKYEHIVKCRLSKRQRQLYDGYMGLADTRESFQSGNYISIINCLMQLRKVCNHPDLFETRQIVTSYAMPRSAVADYEIKELLVRKNLLDSGVLDRSDISLTNLWCLDTSSGSAREESLAALQQLARGIAVQDAKVPRSTVSPNFGRINSAMAGLEAQQQTLHLRELQSRYLVTAERTHRRPLYGRSLLEHLTISKPLRQLALLSPYTALSEPSVDLPNFVTTLTERATLMKPAVQIFGCVTPAVVAPEMSRLALTQTGVDVVHRLKEMRVEDPFHEPRTRLAIAFPDKALIQYDCGKLQQLDRLLRNLQSGGHRALIFTQMTKVLDLLEQFLNLHGHRYLRLDGSTKVEHRQVLTDRFNSDTRILAFILSTRSGGLGINLTGADTVIFYDLDWNPAMDKQCQDRCHRIGQTRDVHIYRFVSEGTIEANILRKSDQKRMLDDVVIQEGDFTTDYFNRLDPREFLAGSAEADAAIDKVFRGGADVRPAGLFEQAEDVEDRRAAEQAQRECAHTDDGDFEDSKTGSAGVGTPRTDSVSAATPGAGKTQTPAAAEEGGSSPTAHDAEMDDAAAPLTVHEMAENEEEDGEDEAGSWEEFMVQHMQWELRDYVVKLPGAERASNKKAKKGFHTRR